MIRGFSGAQKRKITVPVPHRCILLQSVPIPTLSPALNFDSCTMINGFGLDAPKKVIAWPGSFPRPVRCLPSILPMPKIKGYGGLIANGFCTHVIHGYTKWLVLGSEI